MPDRMTGTLTTDPMTTGEEIEVVCPYVDPKLSMNFIGPITRFPKVGSIPAFEVTGCKFYIDGSGLGMLENDVFIPAWIIPEVKTDSPPDPKVVVMKVIQQTLPFLLQLLELHAAQDCACHYDGAHPRTPRERLGQDKRNSEEAGLTRSNQDGDCPKQGKGW